MTALLIVRGLDLHTPGGRPLIRGLDLQLAQGERVAIVGRNGVGKSSLLRVLAGDEAPTCGAVHCAGRRAFVPQHPGQEPRGLSPGQVQRARLERARRSQADLLLLDEPTHDLDAGSIDALCRWLFRWKGGLIVVSHDRRLLRLFDDFFVVAESGCHHVSGSFEHLVSELERRNEAHEERYVRTLNSLVAKERAHERTRRRRERKANRGRLRELARCTPRSVLNGKRSYAQESQGKRAKVQTARLGAARAWAKATRRALAVELPLEVALPHLPMPMSPVAGLHRASVVMHDTVLFEDLDLCLGRQRIAVTGPNGAGKSTLVRTLVGEHAPTHGRASCERHRIAYIAQNASNWARDESTLELLMASTTIEEAASTLRAHRFPFALADRPLRALSPGERLRAALLCAFHRDPPPELLVLDEPTDHLDFAGLSALQAILRAWKGGLLVVSHDAEFLDAVGIHDYVELGATASKKPTEFPSGSCA